jgi:tetratricopeptide (TPR) repeat protein
VIGDDDASIRRDPDDAGFYFNRGYAWIEKKEYDKAIADYGEAIRLDPNEAGSYSDRAGAWFEKKEYDNAIADCGEAMRLAPGDARPYYNRGLAWFEKKEYEKAIADYDEAIRLDPRNSGAYHRPAAALSMVPGFRMGGLLGGLGIGALVGFVPLFLGMMRDETWFAVGGFLTCVAAGLLNTLTFGALAVQEISSIVIVRSEAPQPPR